MVDIKFIKMHGLGNDFVIIDAQEQTFTLNSDLVKKIADRRRGIGCDQVLLIKSSDVASAEMVVFNSDGTKSSACGNGARCVARYLSEKNLSSAVSLLTQNRILECNIESKDTVSICMGKPEFQWDKIPLSNSFDPFHLDLKFEDNLGNVISEPFALSVGNPHVVFFVNDVESINLENLGPQIENHKLFPDKVNVNLVSVNNKSSLNVRVWERGAGLTLACGTGACASVIAAIHREYCKNTVEVNLPGGMLSIYVNEKEEIFMTGPAEFSFYGEFSFEQD